MESEQSFVSRRSESADAQGVAKLITKFTEALFGRINPEHVIEHANLSVSLLSVESTSEVVGHMSFSDQPPCLTSIDWVQWLKENYTLPLASPVNSLFLCLFVAKDGFQQGTSSEVLRTVFMTAPLLHYLFLVVPRGANLGLALSAHFSPVTPVNDLERPFDLYITYRHAHFPMLHIREAKVEDSDDLMPVLLQHSDNVSSIYGEYFLSEMIASQDNQHKTIVAEVDGRAVGFMSVTTEIDIDLLNSSYQLESYHFLRHKHEEDEIVRNDTEGKNGSQSAHTGTPHASTAHTGTPHTSTAHTDTPHTSTAHTDTPHSSTAHTSKVHTGTPHTSTAHTGTPHTSTTHTGTPHTSAVLQDPLDVQPTEKLKQCPSESESPKDYVLKGLCNALAVQLFAIDDRYEMRCVDFLPAVFKMFPDHDFIVLTQPHSVGEFPLLAHFSCVPPQPGATLSQELYVCHKCSLLHSFSVSPVTSEDLSPIEELVSGLQGRNGILTDVKTYLTGKRDTLEQEATPITALVAKCAGQVVGVSVLRDEEDIEFIRSHYNIEDFVYFSYHCPSEHAHLHHLILNPVFSSYGKHFIKETLRLSNKSCLYYHLASLPRDKSHTLINTLHCLVPIRSRRQIVYPNGLGTNAPLPEVTKVKPPFALYHTNRKLTFEPKIVINSRVVVVGGSDTALSLLETLVFCPHLLFSTLTVVSPDGLSCDKSLLGLDTWVNSVRGKMVTLNRSEQYIEVTSHSSKSKVHYDWLVLTCGVQYSPPSLKRMPPPNQVVISDKYIQNRPGPFVVYGCGIDAYTAVNDLLINGVAPDLITLVQPNPPTCFNDPVIVERVSKSLSLAGIRVLSNHNLSEWMVGENGLTSVNLLDSTEHAQTVDCKTCVYLDNKAVDRDAFKALNNACLVLDQRLVITANHSTNDPHILAAGPLTKYSRKYRVGKCSHADFNSEEVGQKLAITLLSKLDPTFDHAELNEEDPVIIPSYDQPKVVNGNLPVGLSYLHISSPPTPGDELRDTEDKGKNLVTDTSNGYFKIHINQYGCVDEVSMLSSVPLTEKDNYLCLYKVHEKYLNNMADRFEQSLIEDLFLYFREPWACALFSDRFPDFMQEIREYLSIMPAQSESDGSLEDRVKALVEDDSSLSALRPQLVSQFNSSPARRLINERLFKFLDYNKQQLPMYAKPDII